jgi:hypothetical protein
MDLPHTSRTSSPVILTGARRHAVQDVDSNCHLSRLTLVGLRAQSMTNHPFPAAIGFQTESPCARPSATPEGRGKSS